MKILIAHNTYQHRGGEDSVADAEAELLRQHGHDVEVYRRTNDDIGAMPRWSVAFDTLWSRRSVRDLRSLTHAQRPDLIHVHNTFPLISPSIYWAASKLGIPVVQTLHNFRLMCPQAMFLRDGKVCEDCLGHIPWRGVVRGCYRGSKAQTSVLAGMTVAHRLAGSWRNKVTRFIALNGFCREKFIQGGLPAEKISTKPNFVDWGRPDEAPYSMRNAGDLAPFLFVGRLSAEKGISILGQAMQTMDTETSLRVAGTGPEAGILEGLPHVMMLGGLSADQIRLEMGRALALVMPSIWYENFPRTLVEAFACGLPVIASRLGAMAELIRDSETGLLFEPGNAEDLAAKLRWARDNPESMRYMGEAARREYEAKYTPEINYRQLMAIYEQAITDRTAP